MIAIAAAALLGAVTFPSSFGGQWSAWPDARIITIANLHPGSFVRVPLLNVDSGADGSYAALRVVDDTGAEIPYAIDPDRHEPSARPSPLPISDAGFVRGDHSQAIVDFGTQRALHEAVRLMTARRDYLEHVEIDASDDLVHWQIVRNDAIIYDVAAAPGAGAAPTQTGDTTIAFTPSHARWLRILIRDGTRPFPILHVHEETQRTPQQALEALGPAQPPDTKAGTIAQTWTFDFGSEYREIDAIEVAGGSPAYARKLEIETSDDGATWIPAQSEVPIDRDTGERGSLTKPIVRLYARHVRVSLENGNDAPMSDVEIGVMAEPHDLVFAEEPRHDYALLSGNPAAVTPRYDLGDVLSRRDWHADASNEGPANAFKNEAYVDRRSITERLPWLVEFGFVVASLLIGALALTTVRGALRKPPAAPH